MGRAKSLFKQTEVTRAIVAARKAGESHVRVEIVKDKLVILLGEEAKSAGNSFDEALGL